MGLFRRIRKLVKDVGSGAKDILRNNPEALMIGAMFGLPALMGGKTARRRIWRMDLNFGTNILGQTYKSRSF